VRSSRRERPSRTRLARWTRKSTIERPDDWGGETVRAADHSRARRAVGGHDRPARGSGGSGFKSRRPDLMSCCSQAVLAMRPAIFVGRVRFKVPPTAGPGDLLRSQRDHGTDTRRSRRWNPAGQPHRAPLAPPGHLLLLLASVLGPQPAALPHRPDVALRQPRRHRGSPRANRRSAVRGPVVILALPTLCRIRSSNEFVRPAGEFAGGTVQPGRPCIRRGSVQPMSPWRPECRFSSASFRQTPRNQRTGCVSAWNAGCP
jgi:hypothetical protein